MQTRLADVLPLYQCFLPDAEERSCFQTCQPQWTGSRSLHLVLCTPLATTAKGNEADGPFYAFRTPHRDVLWLSLLCLLVLAVPTWFV